jgi:hypothetical protein
MQKKCLICGNLYTKKTTCSKKEWNRTKYCSRECVAKSKIGKIPWNKGTTGICKSNSGTFKKGQSSWNKGLKGYSVSWNKGKPKSEKTKRKISQSLMGRPTGRTGALSNFWKGGKSSEYTKLKNSLKWKNWRRAIFERDDYTCQECGERNYKGNGKSVWIHPHHLKSRHEFPELQFDIDNGQTLCRDCHRKTHNYGIKAVRRRGSTGATS